MGRCAVDDEEEPEELIAALHYDMLPHAEVDERLTAPMRLVQQQIRRRIISCKRSKQTMA